MFGTHFIAVFLDFKSSLSIQKGNWDNNSRKCHLKESQDTHSSAFLPAALQLIEKSKHQANGTATETAKLQHEGEPLVVLRLENIRLYQ